jgi:hypothetical protein
MFSIKCSEKTVAHRNLHNDPGKPKPIKPECPREEDEDKTKKKLGPKEKTVLKGDFNTPEATSAADERPKGLRRAR